MYQKYLKRTFDTAVSLIVLMVAVPAGLIVAVLIRIDSKGPAIFKQKRTGMNGNEFSMYKFRTMSCDNNVLDAKQTNQLTTLGKIIRGLSLDEIPQLVNILKGDMSLIGPRPWIPEYFQHMTDEQRIRASVRPGITGLAQARGRNNLDVFDKINYDLLYVQKISFTNDVKIIVLTALALFEKTGAAIEKHGIHQEINILKLQPRTNLGVPTGAFFAELPKQNKASGRITRKKAVAVDETTANESSKKTYLPKSNISKSKRVLSGKNNYTVLMSVYAKEQPAYLESSIQSMLDQTVKPSEILVLKDGPLTPELDNVLDKFISKHGTAVKVVSFEHNRGLGPVLADGVALARNNLIARMDSDDIADSTRCEKQLECFNRNHSYDIVGCNVTEFMDNIENVIAERTMPEHQANILVFSRKRNPFAHPSVMFKKDSVLTAGNYREYKLCEDYDLWVRMIQDGARCYNIQEYLVNMRLSPDFYARRGGLAYVKQIIGFKKKLLDSGYYSTRDFVVSAASTAVVGLMPNKSRSLMYSRFLRVQKTTLEKKVI